MRSEQLDRITRMRNQTFYLIDVKNHIVDTTNPTKLVYEFKVSGSTANLYTIQVIFNSLNQLEDIKCNCPDGISYNSSNNCVCKHCCFVWIRVLRQTETTLEQFFNDTLPLKEVKIICGTCETLPIRDDLINPEYTQKYQTLTHANSQSQSSSSQQPPRGRFDLSKPQNEYEEQHCLICFEDSFPTTTNSPKNVECPRCHKVFHEQCLTEWFKFKNYNCVHCRDPVWSEFGANKNQNKKRKTNSSSSSQYLNLEDY